MNADFLFEIGDTHHVCEDYGRAITINPTTPFIVQSDGCSDPKSPDTDFGARLLVKAAEGFIGMGIENYAEATIAAAYAQAKAIGLHPNCLDATLIVAKVVRSEKAVKIGMWGDGCVAGKRKDGTIVAYVVVSPPGENGSIPFYANYLLDQTRLDGYHAAGKQRLGVYEFSKDGKFVYTEKDALPPLSMTFPLDEFEFVTTFSDGAESFYFRNPNNGVQSSVSADQVIFPLTNFQGSTAGQFVRRQYNIFSRIALKNGWKHYDDFSYGAIYLGE